MKKLTLGMAICAGICFAVPASAISRYILVTDPTINSSTNIFSLRKVWRSVNANAQRHDVLHKLLQGPTASEINLGYMKPDTDKLALVSLTSNGGSWKAYFKKLPGHAWNGTLSIPRFAEVVKRTLKQFSNVSTVAVYVNGTSNQSQW